MRPDEIENKTIEENKEEEIVTLVAGIINATGKMLFWKDDFEMEIGDYAIVENMNGYDLARVIGKVLTTKREASKFSNTKYENMKKTVYGMSKDLIGI